MNNFSELTCFDCGCGVEVFYQDNGAPFYQTFYCPDCKDKAVREQAKEQEDE
ncbi:hypothetical protein HYN70_21965 [Vibrio parahaemolyticus]|nr:hypothetical protein [Vibrio diabolicus]ETX66623.1 hypothetical protein D034_4473 [Vibrio parahaemolyticus Peru-288]MBM5216278.1 hypothetical protein [Vibrio parahaemolyticus]MBM5249043.1 hypothetical protein [Vibrio parahaemolyticus]MBM5348844.1 hypothetical protein [Vibrio parahaemolyticus]MCF9933727.1 hypothetical protein [Vibrio parahaemolyticus]